MPSRTSVATDKRFAVSDVQAPGCAIKTGVFNDNPVPWFSHSLQTEVERLCAPAVITISSGEIFIPLLSVATGNGMT